MRSEQRACFDTNVLIYAFAKDDPRAEVAQALLARGGVIGVQTLNEFVAVAVRKLRMPWPRGLRCFGCDSGSMSVVHSPSRSKHTTWRCGSQAGMDTTSMIRW